jgi:hypothetical protein
VKHVPEAKTLLIYILNEAELPQQLEEYIFVPIYKKANETGCSNYQRISIINYMFYRTFSFKVTVPCTNENVLDR